MKENTDIHRPVLENISDTVFLTDKNGDFKFICPNVSFIFGYTEAEIKKIGNINHLIGGEVLEKYLNSGQEELSNIEISIITKTKTKMVLLVSVKKTELLTGTLLFVIHDITERKKLELKLALSRDDLQAQRKTLLSLNRRTIDNLYSRMKPSLYGIKTSIDTILYLRENKPGIELDELYSIVDKIARLNLYVLSCLEKTKSPPQLNTLDSQPVIELKSLLSSLLTDRIYQFCCEIQSKKIIVAPSSYQYVVFSDFHFNYVFFGLLVYFEERCLLKKGYKLKIDFQQEHDYVILSAADNAACLTEEERISLFDPIYSYTKEGDEYSFYLINEIISIYQGKLVVSDVSPAGLKIEIYMKKK